MFSIAKAIANQYACNSIIEADKQFEISCNKCCNSPRCLAMNCDKCRVAQMHEWIIEKFRDEITCN